LYRFKICIFGDGGVGKTTLVNRYLTGVFDQEIEMTLGMEFYVKKLKLKGIECSLQIWDFAGEREFRALLPSSVIASSGGIFMYDITRYSSLKNLKDYYTIFKENNEALERIPMILVGGKLDLKQGRSIPIGTGINMAKKYNFTEFIECSSKNGKNIDRIFKTLTSLILKKQGLIKIKK
jgi:small GTP-binding protein